MTTRRSRWFIFFVSFCLSTIFQPLSFASPTEVFLLTKGLRCTYLYQHDYHYSYYGRSSSRDSGIIEYRVLDSASSGDTSIIWSILETRNTMYWFQDESRETSFVILDSVIFNMSESTLGNHQYRGHSRIWDFPATNRSYDTLRVYRFADTSAVTLGNRYQCLYDLEPSFDSLWIRGDSGLTCRRWFICEDLDNMFGIIESGEGRLVARTITSLGVNSPGPTQFMLLQNYPNPLNPVTAITYSLPKGSQVRLKIYNVLGEEVADLVQGYVQPGIWSAEFDGSMLASGTYFCRLVANGFVEVKKMMLVK